MKKYARLLSVLLAAVFLHPFTAGAGTMPEVHMKVTDDQDAPVADAVALFWGSAHEGTLTGHGGRHAVLFAVEAVSDASGSLRFPKQDFNAYPFLLNTIYENPAMLLLKPGYTALVLHNDLRIMPTLAEASEWEREGKTVKLKRATNAEIQVNAYTVTTYTDMMAASCIWKRVPRILVAADHIFPNPGRTTTLGMLLMNDAAFAARGCGSPKAFFEPYLRR